MPNPYGMTEFDAAGALTALEAARSNRLRQMLLQRQMAQEDQEAKRQGGIREAFARYGGGGETASAPEALAAPEAVPSTALSPPAAGISSPALTAPAAPPEPDRRQELFSSLLAIDPEQAFQVMQAFGQMDDTQFEATTRRNGVLARAASHLLTLPEAQRSAEFQRIAPMLIRDGGVTRQQLAEFQLTPENLQFVVNQARDIEQLADEARPELRNVGLGETVIDVNARDPATGQPRVVYESPLVEVGGDVFQRPQSMSQAGLPRVTNQQEYEALPPGAVYLDPNGVRRTKGGASPSDGSRTFQR